MNHHLSDFIIFLLAAESRSLTSTAVMSGNSPRYVRDRLSFMEGCIRDTLFVREVGESLRLTDRGEEFYRKLKTRMQQFSRIVHRVVISADLTTSVFSGSDIHGALIYDWMYDYCRENWPAGIGVIPASDSAPVRPQPNQIILSHARSDFPSLINKALLPVPLFQFTGSRQAASYTSPYAIRDKQVVCYGEPSGPLTLRSGSGEITLRPERTGPQDVSQAVHLAVCEGKLIFGLPRFSVSEYLERGIISPVFPEWKTSDLTTFLIWQDLPCPDREFVRLLAYIEKKWNRLVSDMKQNGALKHCQSPPAVDAEKEITGRT